MSFRLTSRSTTTCSSRSIPLPASGWRWIRPRKNWPPWPSRTAWILQQKVTYAEFVPTVDGHRSKAEIRMMFLWPEEGEPILVNNLVRMSQGKMMGVDFNKDKTWVGSSIALHERRGASDCRAGASACPDSRFRNRAGEAPALQSRRSARGWFPRKPRPRFSNSSRECAADTWVRTRAVPCGTTG